MTIANSVEPNRTVFKEIIQECSSIWFLGISNAQAPSLYNILCSTIKLSMKCIKLINVLSISMINTTFESLKAMQVVFSAFVFMRS